MCRGGGGDSWLPAVPAAAEKGCACPLHTPWRWGISPPLPHQPQPAQHTPGVLWSTHIPRPAQTAQVSKHKNHHPRAKKSENPSKPQQNPHSLRVTPPTQASVTLTKLTDTRAHLRQSTPQQTVPKSTLPKGSERDQLPSADMTVPKNLNTCTAWQPEKTSVPRKNPCSNGVVHSKPNYEHDQNH